jgi:hypothetical protein
VIRIRRALIPALVLVAALLVAIPATSLAAKKEFYGVVLQDPTGPDDAAPLREAKVGHIRFLLSWNQVQPTTGPCTASSNYNPGQGAGANNCDWSYYDHLLGNAANGGAEGLPFFFGTPSWTNSARKATQRKPWVPPVYGKADQQAWQAFVGAAVDRYGQGGVFWDENQYSTPQPITNWQIWNEPSSPAYFSPRPDASKYGKLLKLGAKAVHQADQSAKVMLAGVFGTPRRRGGGIDMPDWFDRLYKVKGIEKSFDIAAMHPYAPGLNGVKAQIDIARDKMKENGDSRTKLWISEVGYSSGGPKGQTLGSTPKGQAQKLKQIFKLLKQKRAAWKIGGVSWFSWKDVPDNRSSCKACPTTGLLKENFDEKPSYQAFKRFT